MLAMPPETYRVRSKLCRDSDRRAVTSHNDLQHSLVAHFPHQRAHTQRQVILDCHEPRIKQAIKRGRHAHAICGIRSPLLIHAPRNDVPGHKTRNERQPGHATFRVVTTEHRVTKERLMKPLLGAHDPLARPIRRRKDRRGSHPRRNSSAKPVRLFHQTIPVSMKLVPDLSVQLAAVRKSRHIPRGQLRIEGSEVAELACDRSRGALKCVREFTNQRIPRCDATERHSTVQLERENQLLACPRFAIICRTPSHQAAHTGHPKMYLQRHGVQARDLCDRNFVPGVKH